MSSSTMINERIDIYNECLFCGESTNLKRDLNLLDQVIPRGASNCIRGAQSGDVTYNQFSDQVGEDDIVTIFSAVNASDTVNLKLTGFKANYQAILAKDDDLLPIFTVDSKTLTLHPNTVYKMFDIPPLESLWLCDTETVTGEPFKWEPVDGLDHTIMGVALVGLTTNSDNERTERMSLYKMSQAAEDISEFFAIKGLDSTCDRPEE